MNPQLSATAANPDEQTALDADVEAERKSDEDDLLPFKFYPVLSLGVSYAF